MNTVNPMKFFVAVFVLLLATACASGRLLSTNYVTELGPETGNFNLILYGGRYVNDFKTVAILDREDDPYTIVAFGGQYNSRLFENLPFKEAVDKGRQFITNINFYRATEIKSIIGPDGSVIGYELHPLYMSLHVGGTGDILSTSYLLKEDNTVVAYISLENRFGTLLEDESEGRWGE